MQSFRKSISAAGVHVFNLHVGELRWIGDNPGRSVNVFSSQADAIIAVTGDDPVAVDADQAAADWHTVTMTNGVVNISRPITAIRVTAVTAVNVSILVE